jgi:hypothetical protein
MSLCNELTSFGTRCKKVNCHLHGSNIGTCSICLNPVAKTRSSKVLRCNHRFHKKCINEWNTKGSATCPECRSFVDKYKVSINIQNMEKLVSNTFSPENSEEIRRFIEQMGHVQDFSETNIHVSLENEVDLESFFRDLGICLTDLNSAIFDAE